MNHGNISPEIATGLKVLQARIANAKIPSSKLDETLNIATWNIREFGKKARSEAAIHYNRRDPGSIRPYQHCRIAGQPDGPGPRPRRARADLEGDLFRRA